MGSESIFGELGSAILTLLLIIGVIAAFSQIFFTVQQQTAAVIQRFGKFSRIVSSGLQYKIPFIEGIAGRMSLRYRQLDVKVESKTKDNVFVKLIVSVQYYVDSDHVYEAFYRLASPEQQITAFVFNVVRAKVPEMTIDDVFERKDDIADAVAAELARTMAGFGYGIFMSPITDIEPDANVKKAMNEIIEAQRLRLAAIERAETEKIMRVKAAEAEAESKALQGRGIAEQRQAIIRGFQEAVGEFTRGIAGTTSQEVMNLVLLTQHFDTIQSVGAHARSTTILVPYSPGSIKDLNQQILESMLVAGAQHPPHNEQG